MSAYKKLNKQDSFLTSYTAHKTFSITGSEHDEVGVETYVGVSGSVRFHPTGSTKRLEGTDYVHYQDLVYNSIRHLYYSGFDNAEPTTSSYDLTGSSVENYLHSSYTSQQRRDEGQFTVISIPRNITGVNIKPSSIRLSPDPNELTGSFTQTGYVVEDYEEGGDDAYGAESNITSSGVLDPSNFINNYINHTDADFISASNASANPWSNAIVDDGNGNLIMSGSETFNNQEGIRMPRRVVGNAIYSHGLLILTNPTIANYYANYFSGSLTWKSSHPIYTYNYHCTIKESDFNYTQHPSALKDLTGSLSDNVTGSEFQPYFTTVGLYNDTNELIAVAKMAQPVPVSDNTEMTVVVKLDM